MSTLLSEGREMWVRRSLGPAQSSSYSLERPEGDTHQKTHRKEVMLSTWLKKVSKDSASYFFSFTNKYRISDPHDCFNSSYTDGEGQGLDF